MSSLPLSTGLAPAAAPRPQGLVAAAPASRLAARTAPVAVHRRGSVLRAEGEGGGKFQSFQAPQTPPEEPSAAEEAPESAESAEPEGETTGPRADDVLPDNLGEALQHASEAVSAAMAAGRSRTLVEILLPEFWDITTGPIFTEDGDQQRFWKLNRRFVENIMEQTGIETGVKVVFPDIGVAAMLANQWPDAPFKMASFLDRKPFDDDDELIIFAAPDPTNADACMKLAKELEERAVPLVMFNPRLQSFEVGIGLSVRRIRNAFLQTFQVCYSLRPVGDVGSVFRRFPGLWQVFLEEEDLPGRYKLIAEQPNRPAGEDLDFMIFQAMGGEAEAAEDGDLIATLGSTFTGLQRFMRSLTGGL